jgi:hypothetical protein
MEEFFGQPGLGTLWNEVFKYLILAEKMGRAVMQVAPWCIEKDSPDAKGRL